MEEEMDGQPNAKNRHLYVYQHHTSNRTLHRRQRTEELNAVYIFNTDILCEDPLKDRDTLRNHLDTCHLAVDSERRLLPSELPELLNSSQYIKVCSFFDRDQTIFDWHYTMYARRDCEEPINKIASVLSGGKVVRGPAVILKDCPADLWASLDTTVTMDNVVATIWWYWKSGKDVEHEFGERTMIRVLGGQAKGR
ncbi:hypothetical protein PENSPDRAFT_695438 [Peniophora sp. CONT]|nr:hypothetical protein PENSPDRAFT_695438 [Peniophora sp. CONT]